MQAGDNSDDAAPRLHGCPNYVSSLCEDGALIALSCFFLDAPTQAATVSWVTFGWRYIDTVWVRMILSSLLSTGFSSLPSQLQRYD